MAVGGPETRCLRPRLQCWPVVSGRHDTQQQNQSLQQELQALRQKHEQDRADQDSYLRGVEDRAHLEVDRAREESRAMAVQLKDAGRQIEQSVRRLQSLQTQLSQALQLAAAQLARAETLEQQLSHMRHLPEAKRKPRVRKKRHQATLKINRRCQLAAISEPS